MVSRPIVGFLGSLRDDTRGNALAIMTAAVFPLAGLAGGAVDMSRMYLVKSRLQQACDAGVLAGRRVMTGTSVVAEANAMAQAQNFFNINLEQGAYGATVGVFTVTDVREGGVATGNLTGRVAGRATAEVPMTLMRILGMDSETITATCEANLNIANNDIMFVLDLTGSMACTPAGGCSTTISGPNGFGNYFVTEQAGSKIEILRDAVSDFFTTINSATPPSARLRIGFVPYAVNVNMVDVLPQSAMASSHKYRSREALYNTPVYSGTTGGVSAPYWETYPSGSIIKSDCLLYMRNEGTFATPTMSGGPAPAATTAHTFPHDGDATAGGANGEWGWTGAGDTSGTNQSCRRRKTNQVTTYTTRYAFTSWRYGLVDYDTSRFRDPAQTVMLALGNDGTVAEADRNKYWNALQLAGAATGATLTPSRWDGCIEERDANANIDLPATDNLSRWRPSWPDVYFNASGQSVTRNGYGRFYGCTKPARALGTMTQTQVDAFVANATTSAATRFLPLGYTYHDIGMIWGTRLMSGNGIDASNVTTLPANGRPVKRHIIFMTDGIIDPDRYTYGPYGVEDTEKRISGTSGLGDANLVSLHNQRFLAACQQAKDRGISVWTVSFGVARTSQLTSCADNGQDLLVDITNPQGLQNEFQKIAQRIADLRLSQ